VEVKNKSCGNQISLELLAKMIITMPERLATVLQTNYLIVHNIANGALVI